MTMQTNRTNRPNLLATTATIAALALLFAGGAQGQTTPANPMAQPGQAGQPQAGQPREARPQAESSNMQQAAQELRVARQQIGDASEDVSPQALERARQAVDRLSRAQTGASTSHQGLQQQVTQARQTLQNDEVSAPQARRAIDQLLAALPATAQRHSRDSNTGASAAPAPAQSGGGQPQVAAARSPGAGVEMSRVSNVVGTNVIGSEGRDVGEIENLLIDGNGQVRAAVIEWGGFFGIGARRAVVPMEQLTLGGEDDRVRMSLTREELERLPRYDADRLAEYGRMGGWGDGTRTLR
ncbi:PRC-barrel domain-containing protein [Roseomonas sp. F4]